MKRENPAICADCGRTIDRGVAPDLSGRCERCEESATVGSEDGNPTNIEIAAARALVVARDAIVERLRERYHEARAVVATEESDPEHSGQLDWIFGARGGDDRDSAPLDLRSSELVVLWLEDLIRHLQELSTRGPETTEPGSPASPGDRAAAGLHAATREFADAFRRAADAERRA